MLPEPTLPASLAALLGALRPCFTARSFRTFCGLAAGLAGQVRRRTVVGMLLGAGLAAAQLVVLLLVAPGAPLLVAVDDSLFRRSGRRVHGAGWQHDGSAPSRGKLGFGTCFVTAGIVVALPFCTRPVCLPVLARLVLPGTKARPAGRGHKAAPAPGTKVSVAVALVTQLAEAFPRP